MYIIFNTRVSEYNYTLMRTHIHTHTPSYIYIFRGANRRSAVKPMIVVERCGEAFETF